ncbi:hypothetical protein K458DRAFT_306208, partial [Lentithecium fluviatile CBS 122367]
DLTILLENIYNIDKIDILLGMLDSIKILICRNNLPSYRGASIKQTIVIVIKYISTYSRLLLLLII